MPARSLGGAPTAPSRRAPCSSISRERFGSRRVRTNFWASSRSGRRRAPRSRDSSSCHPPSSVPCSSRRWLPRLVHRAPPHDGTTATHQAQHRLRPAAPTSQPRSAKPPCARLQGLRNLIRLIRAKDFSIGIPQGEVGMPPIQIVTIAAYIPWSPREGFLGQAPRLARWRERAAALASVCMTALHKRSEGSGSRGSRTAARAAGVCQRARDRRATASGSARSSESLPLDSARFVTTLDWRHETERFSAVLRCSRRTQGD